MLDVTRRSESLQPHGCAQRVSCPDVGYAIHLRAICEPSTIATIPKLDMAVDAKLGYAALPVDIL